MTDPNMPKFESMEEMEEWLASQTESTEVKKESSKGDSKSTKASASSAKKKPSASKKRPKKKTAPKDEAVSANLAEADRGVAEENIWSTIHFYTRPGDTVNVTRNDAKEEAKFRNDNVLVFYHDHIFGAACDKGCWEVAK